MAKLPVGTLIPIGAVGTAKAEHVLSPNTFSSDEGVDLTGTMPNNGTLTKTLTNQGDIATVAKGYYTDGTVKANITNLIGSNVKKGIRVGNVLGTYSDTVSEIISIKSDTRMSHSGGDRFMRVEKSLIESGSLLLVYNNQHYNWDSTSAILVDAKDTSKILYKIGSNDLLPALKIDGSILKISLPLMDESRGAMNSGGYVLLK